MFEETIKEGKEMKEKSSGDFEQFLIDNRSRVNKYLNMALWFFIATGPAIALGVKVNYFPDITYLSCAIITGLCLALALVHYLLYKHRPKETYTGLFALTALDILLVYMSYVHVKICLTWFLVPLLSLLFCDRLYFWYALILNYVLMFLSTWVTSEYAIIARGDYEHATAYFADIIGGYTIETFILFAAGNAALKLTMTYFRELFSQNALIKAHEKNMTEKMEILDSMAEIYDNVNLLDFREQTEMSLRNNNSTKFDIDLGNQTHTIMNQKQKTMVTPDHLEAYMNFTNLSTIRTRLAKKKIISADFIDVINGWFRAQFITVDATEDGIPNSVIYTTQNVDEEKRREENLIRISMTDELTRLFNRRSYEEDLQQIRGGALPDTFVLFSVDVNGLKAVNDSKGHAAGDELIIAAAGCFAQAVGSLGKTYRTGGDEFMAILYTEDPEYIRKTIKENAENWHGVYNEEITMSIGYATVSANPEATVDRLEYLADADMYREKDKYYRAKGIERRR